MSKSFRSPWAMLLLTIALPVLAHSAFAQPVLYVDDDATGANDGSSWCGAFVYLQDALAAVQPPAEIRVAQGVYKPDRGTAQTPGDRHATFQLFNDVTLRGGYAGCGAAEPDDRDIAGFETILSGDLNGDDGPEFKNNDENSFHVVTGSGTDITSVIDGFTISGGCTSHAPMDDGGGMYNVSGNPTVTHCTFTHNDASARFGGGMANVNASPTISGCIFSTNHAAFGGGIANMEGSHPIVSACIFVENLGYSSGGGMTNYLNSDPTILNCTFVGNVGGWGGGMTNLSDSNPEVTNCLFSGNTGPRGGGLYTDGNNLTTVTNCTFVGNTSWETGAGGIQSVGSGVMVTNCILWDNLWGSPGDIASAQFEGSGHVRYTCVQDNEPDDLNVYVGVGNIDDAPVFVDAQGLDNIDGSADDNLRLLSGSPCIDAGDNSSVTVAADRDGYPRIVNGTVDMGAYEYQGCDDPADCDDGVFCNGVEACVGGACQAGTAPECDDAVECTDDTCDNSTDACMNVPNHNACDDGQYCNGAETCDVVEGCLAGTPVDCDDGVGCTDDTCENGVCTFTPAWDCCVSDTECDDANVCTDDACTANRCVYVNNAAACEDSVVCTSNDICSGGTCVGTPVADCCREDSDCDGGNPCSTYSCDEGTCVITPQENCVHCASDSDCDDGNMCTDDTCTTGVCTVTNSTSTCDDGDECTESDVCTVGTCAGTAVDGCCAFDVNCDDGDDCTSDTCISNACVHAPVAGCDTSGTDLNNGTEGVGEGDTDGGSDGPVATTRPCGAFGAISLTALLLVGLVGSRRRGPGRLV